MEKKKYVIIISVLFIMFVVVFCLVKNFEFIQSYGSYYSFLGTITAGFISGGITYWAMKSIDNRAKKRWQKEGILKAKIDSFLRLSILLLELRNYIDNNERYVGSVFLVSEIKEIYDLLIEVSNEIKKYLALSSEDEVMFQKLSDIHLLVGCYKVLFKKVIKKSEEDDQSYTYCYSKGRDEKKVTLHLFLKVETGISAVVDGNVIYSLTEKTYNDLLKELREKIKAWGRIAKNIYLKK